MKTTVRHSGLNLESGLPKKLNSGFRLLHFHINCYLVALYTLL